MALETFEPLVVRVFGGLCTFIDRLSLGLGQSPNCQNVQFFPGAVGSRYSYDSFTQYASSAISESSAIYSFKPFVTRLGVKRILYLLSYGASTGTLKCRTHATGTATLLEYLGKDAILTLKGDAMFGRLFLAVSDGASGRARTIATDGASTWEIAPDGPAWSVDTGAPYHNEVTVKTGAGLSVGRHFYTWMFITNNGYITRPGTGSYFDVAAAGTAKLDIYGAPIGPTDTVARILCLTAAGDTNFYYIPKTTIWDNTTRNYDVSVTDAELLAGTPVLNQFTLYTPSCPTGAISYSDRLVLWGCREKAEISTSVYPTYATSGAPNLSFDGGFQVSGDRYYSLGPPAYALPGYWATSTSFTGFGSGTNGKTLLVNGFATAGNLGYVSKSFDASYMRSGQSISMRIRVRRSAVVGTGVLIVSADIYKGSGPLLQTLSLNLDTNTVGTDYSILATAGTTIAGLGTTTATSAGSVTVTVSCSSGFAPADATSWFEIDFIEFVDLNDTSQQNTLRVSRPGEPEAFDIETGLVSVGPDDGEGIRNCFRLRDALYICKERSLYVTKDTGDEPITWPVDLVDRLSGTPSAHGVGYGDGWVVIASRSGLVMFDGSTPQIISQEITPTWNTINWEDPCFVWVTVDPARREIKVGARTTAVSTDPCTLLLTLDYTEGFGNPIPSGQGRKWSVDSVLSKSGTSSAYHHGAMTLDTTGSPRPVFSMTSTVDTPSSPTVVNTLTYQGTGRNDFPHSTLPGAGYVHTIYETAPIGSEIGRSLYDRVVHRVRGSGYLRTYYIRPNGATAAKPDGSATLDSAALTATPTHDIELGANLQDVCAGVRVEVASASDWFMLNRLAVFIKNATYNFLRGHNL